MFYVYIYIYWYVQPSNMIIVVYTGSSDQDLVAIAPSDVRKCGFQVRRIQDAKIHLNFYNLILLREYLCEHMLSE